MALEEDIRSNLLRGIMPQQLIDQGYKKSTVYKIYNEIRTQTINTIKPDWSVENMTFDNRRYLPGQIVPVDFVFRNTSPLDIYLTRIGIQPEWLPEKWHAQEVKDLIKSGSQRRFAISVPIPNDLALNEYEFRFGIEGQYLPAAQFQNILIEWANSPVILEVKRSLTGINIFFSHSTKDMVLVRQLEAMLDKEGFGIVIGEDKFEPGAKLDEKFQRMISQSRMLIALLTEDGVNSEWVKKEVDYAIQIKKPTILLKDKSIKLKTDYEWIEFSKTDTPIVTAELIKSAIVDIQRRNNNDGIVTAVGIGVVGLVLLSLLSGRGGDQ